MHLFPNTTVKEFAACEHGEFISVFVSPHTHSGVCIKDEDNKREFLILSSTDAQYKFRLVREERGRQVLSYGSDWMLSPYGACITPQNAATTPGTFIHSNEGEFLVAAEIGQRSEPVLCRLDEQGIWSTAHTPGGGFSFPHWRVHYFDDRTHKLQKLAGNDPVPEDDE